MLYLYCILVYAVFNLSLFFFFFNDTATTEIYTLSLHDALPISTFRLRYGWMKLGRSQCPAPDRKSTRLNSSHANISYAVFCLKKKKKYKYLYLHKKIKKKKIKIKIAKII